MTTKESMLSEFKTYFYNKKNESKSIETNIEFYSQNEKMLIKFFEKKYAKSFSNNKDSILESLLFDDFRKVIKSNSEFLNLKKDFKQSNYYVASIYKQIKPKNDTTYRASIELKNNKIILSQYLSLPHGHHRCKDLYGAWIQKSNNDYFFGKDIISEKLEVNHENIKKILKSIYHNMHKKYELKNDKIQELLDNSEKGILTIQEIFDATENKGKKIQVFNKEALLVSYMMNKVKEKFKNNSFVSIFDEEDSFLINISSKFKENGEPLYYSMKGQKYDNLLLKKIFQDYYINIRINDNFIDITFDSRNTEKSLCENTLLPLTDENINNMDGLIFNHLKEICKNQNSEKLFHQYYNSIIKDIQEILFNNDNTYKFITPDFKEITYNKIIQQKYPLIIKDKDIIFYNKEIDFKNMLKNINKLKIDIEKAFIKSNINQNIGSNDIKKRI